MFYQKSDGLKYCMEARAERIAHGTEEDGLTEREQEFPVAKKDVVKRFYAFEEYMNENWHSNVNIGALTHGDGLLTDHGEGHVQTVMNNAYLLLKGRVQYLSGFEIYILLMAIHFHDVGNIQGRDGHEKKIEEVMNEIPSEISGMESLEQVLICEIAMVHSGMVDGDKDTIGKMGDDETCLGMRVRKRMLAAVLRFADELADDFSRTKWKNVDKNEANKIYHDYSQVLDIPRITAENIALCYNLDDEDIRRTYKKDGVEIYLYDEILERIKKIMVELTYCRTFASDFLRVNTVNVSIYIHRKGSIDPRERKKLFFRLGLRGYPDEQRISIKDYYIDEGKSRNGFMVFSGEELEQAMKEEKI